MLRKKALLACAAALAASGVIAVTPSADAASLAFTRASYTVSPGGTTQVRVECVQCNFVNAFLQFSVFHPTLARVTPFEVGPITTSPFVITLSLEGLAVGVTTMRAVLFQQATVVLFADVAVSVVEGGGGCPATVAVRSRTEGARTLGALYRFRDRVLSRTEEGRQYTRRFYRHSFEAARLLLADRSLRERAADLLERFRPLLDSAAAGRETVLTGADLSEIDAFVDDVAARASPRLQRTLRRLRTDVRRPGLLASFGVRLERGADETRR